MDDSHIAQHLTRKALHPKRSLKHGLAVDSPLYDASEEDNDELVDEASSISALPSPRLNRRPPSSSPLGPNPSSRLQNDGPNQNHRLPKPSGVMKVQGAQIQPLDNEALDSPTYDGDIESSTTAAPTPSARALHPHTHTLSSSTFAEDGLGSNYFPQTSDSGASRPSSLSGGTPHLPLSPSMAISPTPVAATVTPAIDISGPLSMNKVHPQTGSMSMGDSRSPMPHAGHPEHPLADGEPKPANISRDVIDPSALTPEDIQKFVKAAIDGTNEPPRDYKPNPPPKGRPIRVYADGVYDIFHFGHALQLRQAKLSFPSVHLLVGVNSDELCAEHKSRTVMNHAERCESVRHCRWVDEIVSDAPWVIGQEFLEKHKIDYVAHDEDPYKGSDGSEDVYNYVKSSGCFIPTRRTPGVSTSELLERIVAGYREGDWDAKLVKIGHPELTSRAPSRTASRPDSRMDGKLSLPEGDNDVVLNCDVSRL